MTVTVQMPAEVPGPNAPEAGNPNPASNAAPSNSAPAANTERPSWLPEKFNSPEDLAKSYAELESKLGQSQQPNNPAPANPAPASEQAVTDGLTRAGLNIADFQAEYDKNGGKLSDDSYAKLQQAGYSRDFVNDYIRGQEALAEKQAEEVFKEVGGAKEFAKVTAWAKANLPRAELDAFNRVIDTAPVDALRFAVLGLHSKYVAANGREPRLINGSEPGNATAGFASRHEMVEAMRDPRYKKDEAYRAQVTQRLGASTFF